MNEEEFSKLFGKTTFIEHLNELQQKELYETVKDLISEKKVKKIIDRIDKEFKDDIKQKAKSGDFVINSMLVGANLHITEQLKKELGIS